MSERLSLRILHDDVSAAAEATEAALPFALQCRRGCAGCCADDLTVFEVEAANIRAWVGEAFRGQAPHPPGACAFLDSAGACRVYPVRPYVCRTQGLPLAWASEEGECRDICPLNDPGDAQLLSLSAQQCWTLGPFEGRLAELQPDRRRVRLRTLFEELAA